MLVNTNGTLKVKEQASDEAEVQGELSVVVSQERYTRKAKAEKTNLGFKYVSQIKSARKNAPDYGAWFMIGQLHTRATLAVRCE